VERVPEELLEALEEPGRALDEARLSASGEPPATTVIAWFSNSPGGAAKRSKNAVASLVSP
jgi:hypothetical protein